MEKQYEWLPHVYNALTQETFGYTVTPYSIALEGWRRGLKLTFLRTKQTKSKARFTLSDGEKKHTFVASRGDLVTKAAMEICKNKYETKKYLREANVPTPEGEEFSSEVADEEIVAYANKVGYPLVIKPLDGTGGHGVITNIKNEEEFKKDLAYIREDLNFKHVIVETYFKGIDYRVYVVGNEAVAVAKRISPNVIGDGKSTIKKLIQEKNNLKKETQLYKSSLIKIDKELKSFLEYNDLSLDTIPGNGERVFVKSKNNVTAGGDPVDATEELFPEAKEIAVRALNAIPDLPQGGVDVMVNHNTKEAIILEVNSQANIRLNLFPMEGQGRDIPKAIIDYYFPETKQNLDSPLYFDFGAMWKKVKIEQKKSYPITDHPTKQLKLTRFVVSGNIRNVNYGKWIKKVADEHHIHGYIKHLENETASIVVAGSINDIKMFREIIQNQQLEEFTSFEIKEMTRKTPVMIGFTIENPEFDVVLEDGYFPVRLIDPKTKSKSPAKMSKAKKKNKKSSTLANKNKPPKMKSKKIDYEKEYNKLINSTSWKITRPIRSIKAKLKKNQ